MKNRFPSLITANAQAGLVLASQLAEELRGQLQQAGCQVERPGGMNYLQPAPVPREVIGGILFYAIASANGDWTGEAL
ncbi:MAG TPA: hypothetical protein VNN22_06425 [Verrucomicrobiae bacterium]|nr:hypothetical protein [Verrucomicrobiae bacterium]